MNFSLGTSALMAVPAAGCKSRLLLHWSGNGMDAVLAHLCPAILCFSLACGFIPAVQLWLVRESRGPQEGKKSKGLIFSLNAKLHCEAILSQKGLNKAERHSLAHCSG